MNRQLVVRSFLFLFGFSMTVSADPVIHVEDDTYNFGTQPNTEKVSHTFVVENRGDALLKLTRVKAACGCTVAKVSSREIAPGESATIGATLDLRMRHGKLNKYITVSSNDPKKPSVRLSLVGEALASVQASPSYVNFGSISTNDTPARSIVVTSRSETPFTIKSVSSQRKLVDTEVVTVEEGKKYQVNLKVKPGSAAGSQFDTVSVQTSDATAGLLRVRCSWQISQPFSVTPTTLKLRQSTSGSQVPGYMLLKASAAHAKTFVVESIKWPGRDDVTFTLSKHALGTRVLVRNVIPTPEMTGENIVIRTNIPGYEEVSVPVEILPPVAVGKPQTLPVKKP